MQGRARGKLATGFQVLVVFSSLLASRVSNSQDPDISTLAATHEASVQAAQLVDLQARIFSAETDQLLETWQWTSDGARRRMRIDIEAFNRGDGKYLELFDDGERLNYLQDFAPDGSAVPTLRDQNGIVGEVRYDPGATMPDRLQWFVMQRFRLTTGDVERSLPSLIQAARATPNARTIASGDRELVEVTVPHPGVVDDDGSLQHSQSDVVVFLDPALGYTATRVDNVVRDRGGDLLYTMRFEAADGWIEDSGAFLPRKVNMSYIDPSGTELPAHSSRMEIEVQSLNRPLPQAALDFRFPENLLVTDRGKDGQAGMTHVVGANGQFVETFSSFEELEAYASKRDSGGLSATGRMAAIVISALLAAVLLAFFVLRRKAQHA